MGVPSLSQIVNWDTEHLERAASDWADTATQWEDHFTTVHRGTLSPGGTTWEGEAAEAAQERTYVDLVKVRGFGDALHEASSAARLGAGELDFAKRRTLDAVAEAEEAGFAVGEDLSVTSREIGGDLFEQAKQRALAQQHSGEISARAAELSAVDKQVAASITAATAPLGEVHFTEAPDDQSPHNTNGVQLVDYRTFKQGPNMSPTPEPGTGGDGPAPKPLHPDYPNRTTDGKYGLGNSADGKWQEQLALDKDEQVTGVPIIRQQVRATHSGVLNPDGSLQGRFYDGLQPTGNPGEYIGIEAKTDGVKLTGPQAKFDAQVTPQNPATATLNGQPIKIVDTRVVYPDLPTSTAAPPSPSLGTAGPAAAPTEGSVAVPGPLVAGGGGGGWHETAPALAPPSSSFPDWGTYIPPEVAANSDGIIGILGKAEMQSPEYQASHPPPTA